MRKEIIDMAVVVIDYKKIFIDLLTEIPRKGMPELIDWLNSTDFFVAPASSRFHLCEKGGLIEHSLNVYNRLKRLWAMEMKLPDVSDITEEDDWKLRIVSLLHDLCKIGLYKESFRNVKNDDGKWEKVPCYAREEQFVFGYHGCKSVWLASKYLELTDEESVAIANHMGAFDRPANDFDIGSVFESNKLALLLHTADCFASFVDEAK